MTKTVIHLVHGTWPRALGRQVPAWYEKDSDFRNKLVALLGEPAKINVFEWSGKNSIRARQDAAKALARHLALAKSESPGARHFVIAHSHGGNIGLDAVRIEPVSGLITMATPFVRIQPMTVAPIEGWLLDYALVATIRLPLLIGMLTLGYYQSTRLVPSEGLSLIVYALYFGLFMTLVLPQYMFEARSKLAVTTFESSAFGDVPELMRKPGRPKRVDSPPLRSPLLMIRADGDEASRALAIARAGAETWGMMWNLVCIAARLLSPVILRIIKLPKSLREVIGLMIALVALGMAFYSVAVSSPFWPYLLAGLTIFSPGLIVGFVVSPFLVGTVVLYALAFGWEMLFIVYLVDIRATDTPFAVAGEMVRVSAARRVGQLRHSVYNFPTVPGLIASWINSSPR